MKNIRIQPCMENYEEYAAIAEEYGLSFEIIDFALVTSLNKEEEFKARLDFYKQCVKPPCSDISMHGPFIDLYVHSPDRSIRNVSRKRIMNSLMTAKELGVSSVVFHTNFLPMIREERYSKAWIKENAEFWSSMLSSFPMHILLENMWDDGPQHLKRLLSEVGSDRLKVCFDTGHCSVYSKVPMREWFDVLEGDIEYFHINDNDGWSDQHLPLGEGCVNWEDFSFNIEKIKKDLKIVLEVGNTKGIIKSLKYMEGLGLYR